MFISYAGLFPRSWEGSDWAVFSEHLHASLFHLEGGAAGENLTSCQLQRVTCKVSVVLKAGKSVSLLIASFYIHMY